MESIPPVYTDKRTADADEAIANQVAYESNTQKTHTDTCTYVATTNAAYESLADLCAVDSPSNPKCYYLVQNVLTHFQHCAYALHFSQFCIALHKSIFLDSRFVCLLSNSICICSRWGGIFPFVRLAYKA